MDSSKNDNLGTVESDKDINVELVGWIQKFLFPYSLDPMPLRPNDVPVQGGLTIGQIIG